MHLLSSRYINHIIQELQNIFKNCKLYVEECFLINFREIERNQEESLFQI